MANVPLIINMAMQDLVSSKFGIEEEDLMEITMSN
jgi:hypothetical protein